MCECELLIIIITVASGAIRPGTVEWEEANLLCRSYTRYKHLLDCTAQALACNTFTGDTVIQFIVPAEIKERDHRIAQLRCDRQKLMHVVVDLLGGRC